MTRQATIAAVVIALALAAAAIALVAIRGRDGSESGRETTGMSSPATTESPTLAARGPAPKEPSKATTAAPASPPSVEKPGPDAEAWLRQLLAAVNGDEVVDVLKRLERLSPEDVLAVLRAIYPRVAKAEVRRWILDRFAHHGRSHIHLYALSILDLGARDPDQSVAAFAIASSEGYALRPLSLDDGSYEVWRREMLDRPLVDALKDATRRAARSLVGLEGEAFVRAAKAAGDLHAWRGRLHLFDAGAIVREEGAWAWLLTLALDPARDEQVRVVAIRMLAGFSFPEADVERDLAPIVVGKVPSPDAVVSALVPILAKDGGLAATAPLLAAFEAHPPDEQGRAPVWVALANALRESGRKEAIPTLIAALEVKSLDPDHQYTVRHAIATLTNGPHGPLDGAAWREWWFQHRSEFGPTLAGADIPTLRLTRK